MNNSWTRLTKDSMPPEGTNVFVSDGTTITQAYFILSDNHINWFFHNSAYKDIIIDYWMPMPPLPPKIVKEPIENKVQEIEITP